MRSMENLAIAKQEYETLCLEEAMEHINDFQSDRSYCDENLFFADQIRDIPNKTQMKLDSIAIVALCLEGHADSIINGRKYQIQQGDLVLCMNTNTLFASMVSTDFRCTVAGFSIDKIHEIVNADSRLVEYYFYFQQHPILHLTQEEMMILENYKNFDVETYKTRPTYFKKEIKDGILKAIIYEILSFCVDRYNKAKNGDMSELAGAKQLFETETTHNKDLVQRFLKLLIDDDCNHRTVQYFADQLFITPKYLSSLVSDVTGQSPSIWIQQKTIEKIKKMLTTSSISCKEIAFQLDFCNSSSFGKYVKQHLGCSPQEYRRKNRVQL